ncbi:MAG: response regulator [Betaproteobacteria bacterium]|nr:response regulator [Betaproteobacteria bacterium]
MAIRIVLADDHASYRTTVRDMLNHEPDLEVVAEADDGDGAIQADEEQVPDVIIMDIAMPRVDGIEATRRILSRRPAARVLALSLHTDTRFVDAMLDAGAAGYVLKQDAFADLLDAVHQVVAGRTFVSPNVVATRPDGPPRTEDA